MGLISSEELSDHVSRCLELAILLEVSAYPKPGNVHRTADFTGTRYEHFLASAVAVASHFRKAAERGIAVSRKEVAPTGAGVGKVVRGTVQSVAQWQNGGNTLLGSILLLSPMAIAAGMIPAKQKISLSGLRENLKLIVESTTSVDAVDVYEAITLANPSALGQVPRLDVTDPTSKQRILAERVTLFDVFKIAADYDSIASEWVKNYPITFDLGYPFFVEQLGSTKDINVATVHTFLEILSRVPDTFIARKVGLGKAKDVSTRARQVLNKGGLTTRTGTQQLWNLDKRLRDPPHALSPGTTADITQAVLALAILEGYRP